MSTPAWLEPPGPLARLVICALIVLAGGATSIAAAPLPTQSPETVGQNGTVPPDGSIPSGAPWPSILAVYPNPVATGDAGEFVVVSLPPGADRRGLSLDDGEGSVELPARVASLPTGRVVVRLDGRNATGDRDPDDSVASSLPLAGTRYADAAVVHTAEPLSLANGGERLRLRRGNRTLDAVRYSSAAEGDLWLADESHARFVPLGATDREPTTVTGVSVRAFALPDAPGPPLATLRNATRRLYLAGYTFTSRRVARALRRAADRGVDVRVLVDGGPVGGVERREAAILDALAASNVSVAVVDGPHQRYRFHHAKYAVADDEIFVTSENWEASGVGGHGSRGWGTVATSPALADRLAGRFRGDAAWRAARSWTEYRSEGTVQPGGPPSDTAFPTRFPVVEERATAVTLLTAPDNAGAGIRRLIGRAEREVLVQQVRIDTDSALLAATLAAARRGVRVKLLLGGAWYVREENRNLSRRLNRLAAREDLPLAVRLAEPRSRYSHVHVKGVVVDGERALVGSINWNPTSVRENREVALVVQDRRVGRHYRRLFLADWRGGAWRLPVGALAGIGAVALGAGLALRRLCSPAGGLPGGREAPSKVGGEPSGRREEVW